MRWNARFDKFPPLPPFPWCVPVCSPQTRTPKLLTAAESCSENRGAVCEAHLKTALRNVNTIIHIKLWWLQVHWTQHLNGAFSPPKTGLPLHKGERLWNNFITWLNKAVGDFSFAFSLKGRKSVLVHGVQCFSLCSVLTLNVAVLIDTLIIYS